MIVSNHGGRHLDNTLATVEVVSEAVAAAKGKWRFFSMVASGEAPML